jgi:hypothetical protein
MQKSLGILHQGRSQGRNGLRIILTGNLASEISAYDEQ